ncbi:MAG: YdeI/OmpD-associated family protein [Aestuariivirga sp.]
MPALHFQTKIEIYNANPYVLVSAARAKSLQAQWNKPMPVLVQINGEPKPPWQVNMMPIGDGNFYLYLHGIVRNASNTKVGDLVIVDVSFDANYKKGPVHPLPEWFGAPLSKNEAAQQAWNALIPSRKKEILRYFSGLKSEDARTRNVEKALHVLSGNEGRFMARAWRGGA